MYAMDRLNEMVKVMHENLSFMHEARTAKDRQYWANEYYRVKAMYDAEVLSIVKIEMGACEA